MALLSMELRRGDKVPADVPEALRLARAAAALDCALGWCALASHLDQGVGVAADPAEAKHCFEQAARGLQEFETTPEGLYQAGWMCANGRGVPKDEERAMAFYRRAAEQGHRRAQFNLAVYHEKQPAELRRWLLLAAAHGHSKAMLLLGKTLIREDTASARRWLQQAAASGLEKEAAPLLLQVEEAEEPPDAFGFRQVRTV
jgi:TPR repeat protein